jgi:uncharacterized membrane protein
MNKPWVIIIVLLGIFVAGGVTGGFFTARVCKNKMLNRPVPEEWAPRTLKRLIERLELTPAQQDEIRPIIRRNMEELNRVRNQSLADTQYVVEGMQSEISGKLTPEQRTKYEQLNRELREAREKREKEEREKRLNLDKSLGEKQPPKGPEKDKAKPSEKPPGD